MLAADRTRLANERTLLSYIRTAVGFVATGVGVVYLFDAGAYEVAGLVLVAAAVGTLAIGVTRYRSVARDLDVFISGVGLRSRQRAGSEESRRR